MTSSPRNNLRPSQVAILKALAAAGGISDWLTAPTVARDARKRGETLNAPTIYRTLSSLRTEVEYRTVDSIRRFHIKQEGLPLAGGTNFNGGPTFVVPGTPWSTQREMKSFLKDAAVIFLFVVDPYVSEDTLDVLAAVKVPIQILTAHAGRKGKEAEFLRAYKKFRREKSGKVELRTVAGTELHGRYIFTDSRGWVVDHSLQDLGTKPALVLPLHLESVFTPTHNHFVSIFQKGFLIS